MDKEHKALLLLFLTMADEFDGDCKLSKLKRLYEVFLRSKIGGRIYNRAIERGLSSVG